MGCKTYWDDVYDEAQGYQMSGWNFVIEWWYSEMLAKMALSNSYAIRFAEEEIKLSRERWREHRDKIQQALLDYEQSRWTTFRSINGGIQKVRIGNHERFT